MQARSVAFWMAAATLGAAGGASAAPAHQHGVAKLDLALDRGRLEIALETPLDNLLGFERAPRTEAERKAAAAAVAALQRGQTLFQIDPAADCKLESTELVSAPLGLGKPGAKAHADHGDLDASWVFRCSSAPRHVEVGLFDAFVRLQRLEVQLAGPKGQSRTVLTRTQRRLGLQR